MEQQVEPEADDTTSLDETLEVLKRNTKEIHDSMKQAIEAYQRVMMSCKEEGVPFHERKCRVHGALKLWSIQHGYDTYLSIKEFLQVVFEDYGKNKRLDISQRSLRIDDGLAKLLGKPSESIIELGDFFILVVDLFEQQS